MRTKTSLCWQKSIVKSMVLPVVMYRCESWTIKKAECWRTDTFKLWWWRRLLRVPSMDCKEIIPEYSPDGWMLKFQHFGHLMRRANSLEKILMLGMGGRRRRGDRGWDGWMASPSLNGHQFEQTSGDSALPTQWTWVWVNSGSWWWTEKPGVPQSMGLQRVGRDWGTGLNWTQKIMENRGAWRAEVHEVATIQTRLSDWITTSLSAGDGK